MNFGRVVGEVGINSNCKPKNICFILYMQKSVVEFRKISIKKYLNI